MSAADAEQHILEETAGNGVVTTRSFDARNGLVRTIQAGPSGSGHAIANLYYGFDTTGSRTHPGKAVFRSFVILRSLRQSDQRCG
jgi:hypothetical protein